MRGEAAGRVYGHGYTASSKPLGLQVRLGLTWGLRDRAFRASGAPGVWKLMRTQAMMGIQIEGTNHGRRHCKCMLLERAQQRWA